MHPDPSKPPITPETRVGDLLTHYPALEEVLIACSPAYQALKNPVLRRTVAKVATLRQVARVGGIPVGTLITRLRAAAGVGEGEAFTEESEEQAPRPVWANPAALWRSYDARKEIETGGQPMERVLKDLAQMAPGQVYELVTPFVPAPLVDLARRRGFLSYSAVEGEDLVRTYFTRP
ncbi:MAG: DUF1858 domain-containing protein [Armatimonadota bacterium]|nr:DUF1858 domain-containing protein [Armatimonadota bacterium]